LRSRRRSSIKQPRASASEFFLPKSFELEQRLARLEVALKDTRAMCEALTKQVAALQAQSDHLAARVGLL
jgi:hypothetical protein